MTSSSRSTLKVLPRNSDYVEMFKTEETKDVFQYLLNTIITDSRYSMISGNILDANYLDKDTHNYVIVFSTSGRRTSFMTSFILGNIHKDNFDIDIICGKSTMTYPYLRFQPKLIADRHGCRCITITSLVHLISFYKNVYYFSFRRDDLVAKGKTRSKLVLTGNKLDKLHTDTIESVVSFINNTYTNMNKKQKIKKQNQIFKHAEEYMNHCLEEFEPKGKVPSEEFVEKRNLSAEYMGQISKIIHLILLLVKNGYNTIYEGKIDIPVRMSSKRYKWDYNKMHRALSSLRKSPYKNVNYYGYKMYQYN